MDVIYLQFIASAVYPNICVLSYLIEFLPQIGIDFPLKVIEVLKEIVPGEILTASMRIKALNNDFEALAHLEQSVRIISFLVLAPTSQVMIFHTAGSLSLEFPVISRLVQTLRIETIWPIFNRRQVYNIVIYPAVWD